MASVTWGGGEISLAEDLHDWGRRAVPVLDYTLAFSLQLRKNTGNLTQGSRVAKRLHVTPTWLSSRDSLGWPAARQFTSITRGTSVSPRSAQMPSKLPD
jgi:hypothetical protein